MTRLQHILAVLAVASSAAACHHRAHHAHVEDVRGPDGRDWKKYSCPHLDKRCFDLARSMCPNGYYFAKDPVAAGAVDEAPREGEVRGANEPPRAKTLPPQEKWGKDMYSKAPGTLMVRCADPRARESS